MVDRLTTGLRSTRSGLSPEDAGFLVACALAVFASTSYHRANPPRFENRLYRLGASALFPAAPPPWAAGEGPVDEAHRPFAGSRASRREMLVMAAAQLFSERGYPAVSMDDIGEAVGIAGPSVYRHFPSKADLLAAGLHREAEWLQLGMSRALAAAATERHALELLVASYVNESLEHPELFSVLLTESIHLRDEASHVLRRIQHDYVFEWVRLLRAVRPQLSEAEGRVVVQAVLGIVHDCARHPRWSGRPNLRAQLASVGVEVLLSGSRSPGAGGRDEFRNPGSS